MTRVAMAWFCSILLLLAASAPASLAQTSGAAAGSPEIEAVRAPVEIDGRVLLRVRGVASYQPQDRAEAIAARIVAMAEDPGFRPEMLGLADQDGALAIMAGEKLVMLVHDEDAKIERASSRVVAQANLTRIRQAVEDYRRERTSEAVLHAAARALGATAALAASLALLLWLRRRGEAFLEAKVHARVRSFEIRSFEIVRGERLWSLVRWAVGTGRVVATLVVLYVYLHFVLGSFPWTRWMASRLGDWVVGPLRVMAAAALAELPNLIFLVVLTVVVRYVLRLLKLFFEAVAEGRVELDAFDRDWATPTYKIVRLAVIVFALVVAYPYIPGSDSAAFKGISVFIGVVFSIGSSSVISNTVAGYALIYRRAFKVGDRIRIGDALGDVTVIRNMVTHLKTPKNEEVVIPNSEILRQDVVNYSSLAASHGLILHTTVGIGYETPWRQVEAMLVLAARRTPGLLESPPPFVNQKALGDFCVTYELNVACNTPQAMVRLYTELHRNILDVFNEYGVQIMTPAYEGDPNQPKVVPRDQWFQAPAAPQPPDRGGSESGG
ncbi:MAG: mechanosensitive ion channel family protein [Thermoanaerobaculaceae bacterium]|nr:mechanosensitive ion channel family protein [Thermoanaerobaculaceae bacterium]